MKKIILFSALIFSLFAFILVPDIFSQSSEQITVTTYYPSPYGVYKNLETGTLKYIPQSSAPTACNNTSEGMMYYDSTKKNVFVCDGSNWKAMETDDYEIVASAAVSADFPFYKVTAAGKHKNFGSWKRIPQWSCAEAMAFCSDDNCIKIDFGTEDTGRGIYFIEWGAVVQIDDNAEEGLRLQCRYRRGDSNRLIQEIMVNETDAVAVAGASFMERDGSFVDEEVDGSGSVYLNAKPWQFFIRGVPTKGALNGNKRIEATVKSAYINIYKLSSF